MNFDYKQQKIERILQFNLNRNNQQIYLALLHIHVHVFYFLVVEEALKMLKRDGFDPSELNLYQLGEELGLNRSLSHIEDYLMLLGLVCMVLGFSEEETSTAMSNVHLKAVLILWVREVDNVSERGGATKMLLLKELLVN